MIVKGHYFTRLSLAVATLITSVVYTGNLHAEPTRSVPEALSVASRSLFEAQLPTGLWNYSGTLGPHYAALYLLALDWLGEKEKHAREREELAQRLVARRFPNGAWPALIDPSIEPERLTDLNASIINYWYLKSRGVSIDSPPMKTARAAILKRGGLEGASLFTKILLANFNNASWAAVPSVPFALFKETGFLGVNDSDLGQWVGPHLLAIAYMKELRLSRDLGPRYRVDELSINPKKWLAFRDRTPVRRDATRMVSTPSSTSARSMDADVKFSTFTARYLKWFSILRERQRAHGSWGAYTLATFLSMMTLDDFQQRLKRHPKYDHPEFKNRIPSDDEIRRMIHKGASYCSKLTFQTGVEGYLNGITQDGRNWDTPLAGLAILAAKKTLSPEENDALILAGDALVATQHENGGFGFGWDFESDPDVDDTAEILMFLGGLNQNRYRNAIAKGDRFLRNLQNRDGGWGAFARNNNGNFLIKLATQKFENSADLFDESSPDVTGHVLEAYGVLGLADPGAPFIRKAIRYLERTREKSIPAWSARWGVNTIYGTSAVLVGLLALDIPADHPLIEPSLEWIASLQNKDGGFGETILSYVDLNLAGKGISTPSQTAWAMLPLLKAKRHQRVVDRAAQYLLVELRSDGRWVDQSVVGTGHPGLIYMDYYSYPRTWPLMALGHYQSGRVSPASSPVLEAKK
jgi:squalene-hopene/tetraprenyl-beta-curcumene cyclase